MNIVRYLEPEQPVYGIRSTDPTLTSIEAMANRYIELIQEVQPIGPYTILGYSMGGYVAFEIAKQLVNKGETISHLVLIDTKPLFENQKIELSEIQEKLSDTEETLKDVLIGFANPDLTSQQIKDLSQMDFEKQLAYILQQMKTSNRATPNAEISWLRELISNVYRNQDAIRYYRPGKYSGKVTLITAAEGVNDRDENLDWNKFTQSDVVLYNIPGNHYTIIKEPNVKFLADKIHLCIRGRL
jgi:thioesterase domain-containing protein